MDWSKPIEVAEDIFWVGYVIPGDAFQCHVYLIRNGRESILIDPGSKLTLPVVLEKVTSLVKLSDIKYIIFHHQDPDITGSFEVLETLFPPGERYAVTHWRTATLLKHYGWKTPFWLVDRHNWRLEAGDRVLEFVFTPYAHFPGAFVTYDVKTGALFSSDIFGAISDRFMLFAEDVPEYYEGVELFHKHYMPSNLILGYALDRIMEKNPAIILPQHGSIIPKELIPKVVQRLRKIDCGLFLIDDRAKDLWLLAKLEEVLKRVVDAAISSYDLKCFVNEIYKALSSVFPSVRGVEICAELDGEPLSWVAGDTSDGILLEESIYFEDDILGCFRVYGIGEGEKKAAGILMSHIGRALGINLHREIERVKRERERKKLEEDAERDPLTGLYNRWFLLRYLEEISTGDEYVGVLFLDIDHFKHINDRYGHLVGDEVLKWLAGRLMEFFGERGVIVRYGGEEFIVLLPGLSLDEACNMAEAFRCSVASTPVPTSAGPVYVSVSIGVALHSPGAPISRTIRMADELLYKAKRAGRNRVECGG